MICVAAFCCQLRSFLTESLFDQMPILTELQRYLEQLAIMEPPAIKSELIIEQVVFFSSKRFCHTLPTRISQAFPCNNVKWLP